ncbi:MAG: hypothetical protein M0R46_00105 [Candidatus Muirbacterium halophilum]|nr:hypothetical protein [Candidatus Muirbacterium halophilum]MCK9474294.1 hypothetical protein [Candidatus Muirbacterium halophilum]
MKTKNNYKGFIFFTLLFISASLVTMLSGFNFNAENNFKVSFDVKPLNNSFVCEFKISDINTGKILSNPKLICNNGQKSTISVKTDEGLSIHADILVMTDINSLNYSIALVKKSKEIYKQNTSINLK